MFDDVLGELTEIQDRGSMDGYTVTVNSSFGSLEVDLLLYGTPLDETLPLARTFVAKIESHLDVARRHHLSDFLPIHNSGYLDEGEARISAETFLRKAGRPTASIDLDGEINFTFSHEDLLWGTEWECRFTRTELSILMFRASGGVIARTRCKIIDHRLTSH